MTTPRRTLLTGPAGSGKTHRALERVKEAATLPGERGRAAGRPGDVLFVLPTYAQALHLARAAMGWWDARAVLDDPFATFTSAGERYLGGFQVRALPSAVERDGLMEQALRGAAIPLFDAIRDRPGFRARLLRLVKEVKQSGRPVDDAAARLEASLPLLGKPARARLEAFLVVFERYEALLQRAGLEDHEDTLRRLLVRLEEGGLDTSPRLLVVDGFDDLTPVEQRILDALADAVSSRGGFVLVTLPWDERRPRLFAGSCALREHLLREGYVEERLAGFPRSKVAVLERLATGLFLEAEVQPHRDDDIAFEVIVAGDPEDEAEALARHARRLYDTPGLLRGWRDIGVVVRRLDEAGPRIEAAFDRLRVPVRLIGSGTPLAAEGLVRALEEPLRVLGGGGLAGQFQAAGLVRWLRWCARCREDQGREDRVDRIEIACRREGWPQDFASFLSTLETGDPDLTLLADMRARIAPLRGAAAIWPLLAQAIHVLGPLPALSGLDARGHPVDLVRDRQRQRAVAARDRLSLLVGGLHAAAGRTGVGDDIGAEDAVRQLVDQVGQARLALPDRRLDAVNVLDAEEARHWEIPVVLVAGLAQHEFPLRPNEDVLVRDSDRVMLREQDGALALPLARDRETRERRLFYGAVTRASKRLVLVRPGFDPSGKVRPPTLFLQDVDRVVRLEDRTTIRPPGRAAPRREECFTPADWISFAAATSGSPRASPQERGLAEAILARRAPALRARAARWRRSGKDAVDLGRYGARLNASVALVSPTRIRDAIACPYRYFLQAVVGVPQDDVPLAGPSYGARETGSLAHAVFRRAVAHPEESVDAVVETAVREVTTRRELPPLDPVTRELQTAELVRMVRLLRVRDGDHEDGFAPLPDGLERSFGTKDALWLEGSTGRIRLRGQIDRIDRLGPRAVVMDYKLSKTGAAASAQAFGQGLDVQLPLYALAVERLYDGLEVVGLEWVAAKTAYRHGTWATDALPALRARADIRKLHDLDAKAFRAMLLDALDRSVDALARISGADHDRQLEDPKRCGTCAWYAVCRPSHRPPARDDAS